MAAEGQSENMTSDCPNVDKWRDDYYFNKDDDLYLVVNTHTKIILYTEEPAPEIPLVGLKEIHK